MNKYNYPDYAGHKVGGASEEAAMQINNRSKSLMVLVEEYLLNHPEGINPDKMAGILQENILNIRPRFTQLAEKGRLIKTDKRAKTISGNSQHIYIHKNFHWNFDKNGQANLL